MSAPEDLKRPRRGRRSARRAQRAATGTPVRQSQPARSPASVLLAVLAVVGVLILLPGAAIGAGWVYQAIPVASSAVDERSDARTVTLVGDSYTSGTANDSGPGFRWTDLLQLDVPVDQTVLARYGSGYLRIGQTGAPITADVDSVPADSDVILVFGSRNDRAGYNAVRIAAEDYFSALRRQAPRAIIVAVSAPWVDDAVPAAIVEDRDAVRDAAAQTEVEFVDALDSRWLLEDPGLIGPDGIHPNDAGHAVIAEKMSAVLNAALGEADERDQAESTAARRATVPGWLGVDLSDQQ